MTLFLLYHIDILPVDVVMEGCFQVECAQFPDLLVDLGQPITVLGLLQDVRPHTQRLHQADLHGAVRQHGGRVQLKIVIKTQLNLNQIRAVWK